MSIWLAWATFSRIFFLVNFWLVWTTGEILVNIWRIEENQQAFCCSHACFWSADLPSLQQLGLKPLHLFLDTPFHKATMHVYFHDKGPSFSGHSSFQCQSQPKLTWASVHPHELQCEWMVSSLFLVSPPPYIHLPILTPAFQIQHQREDNCFI